MTAILPPIPRVVFTILEPISLVAGALAPLIDPPGFVSSQLPLVEVHRLYETEQVLSLQLGNLYLLLCMLGVFILNTTTEARVVHAYIVALAIADIGHVGACFYVMGIDAGLDWRNWNPMAMGNIGATAALFMCRSAYMLGLFGKDRKAVAEVRTRMKQV